MNRKEFEALLSLEGYRLILHKHNAHWYKRRKVVRRYRQETKWYARVMPIGIEWGMAISWGVGMSRKVALRRCIRLYVRKPQRLP